MNNLPALRSKEELVKFTDAVYQNPRLRQPFIEETAWPLLPSEVVDVLATMLGSRPTIEVAAGTGYLAAHLRALGCTKYKAYDNRSSHYEKASPNYGVILGNALQVNLEPFHAVVMSWPCHKTNFASSIAKKMTSGQILYFQGDWRGCTADNLFFELLGEEFTKLTAETDRLNKHHVQYDFNRDEWYVFKKL